MLHCIGETPISSLSVTGLVEVDAALAVLNEVSRRVQAVGYQFNSETDYPLVRDVDGKIKVPTNTLSVDTTKSFSQYDIVRRSAGLYDKATRTYVFDRDIEVDIVFLVEWEDLPESARQYIMITAARIFQARQLGSETQHKFSTEQEYAAKALFDDEEGSTGDYNIFNGSYSVATILDR
jgi:hypothetical protein